MSECRLCGQKGVSEKFTSNGCDIGQCLNCHIYQIIGGVESELIYEEDYFNNRKYTDVNALNKEHSRRANHFLLRYLHKESRVLDMGCASGDFVEYAKEYFDIRGCDLAETAIKVGQKRFPHLADKLYVQSATQSNDSETEIYDAVCMWDVIEHIPYPMKAVEEAVSKIKNRGYLFISTPYPDALFARITGKYWPFMTPPEHVCFFGKKGLEYIAEQNDELSLIDLRTRGKWANMGFIMYKAKRVLPWLPNCLLKLFRTGILQKLSVYVPTKDIVYAVYEKNKRIREVESFVKT